MNPETICLLDVILIACGVAIDMFVEPWGQHYGVRQGLIHGCFVAGGTILASGAYALSYS